VGVGAKGEQSGVHMGQWGQGVAAARGQGQQDHGQCGVGAAVAAEPVAE